MHRSAQLIGWVAALGSLAVLVLLDLLLDPSTVLSVLFAIAPLIACSVLSPLSTAAVAALAAFLAVASGWWNHVNNEAQQGVRIVDVLVIGGAAVAVAAVRVHRERRFAEVSQIAEAAQRAILPVLPREAGGVEISARYESAAEGALVGGDLYDCYHHGDLCRIIVGDVRGKGIAGVEQAARVIRAFRQAAARARTLTEVVEDMDDYLVGFFDAEEFVTAVLVEVEGDPGSATLVDAGHPPPLHLRNGGGLQVLDLPAGLPMGTGLRTGYQESRISWAPGDRLLLYTDGLSEARDRAGEFLRLEGLTGPLHDASAPAALQRVLDAVRDHVPEAHFGDDLALVLLENAAPAERVRRHDATGLARR